LDHDRSDDHCRDLHGLYAVCQHAQWDVEIGGSIVQVVRVVCFLS
jgi:hypothetical protein